EVAGASYSPADGHCNSLKLLRALHIGMERRGVTYLANHRVESIAPRAGEFGLRVPGEEIRSAKLVLAAGLGNAHLAPFVGLDVPVRPQRGQLIVTEKTAPFLRYP